MPVRPANHLRVTVQGNTTIDELTHSVARKLERKDHIPNIHRMGRANTITGKVALYHIIWVPIVMDRSEEDQKPD